MSALAQVGIGLAIWAGLATVAAVAIGRAIHAADDRCCPRPDLDDEIAGWTA